MIFERRISINGRDYFLGIELRYAKDKVLEKADGSGFDMRDLDIMIDTFEESYEKESKEIIYDSYIPYMNDVIYLYDRFPFDCYIKDIKYGIDEHITYVGCIYRDEIIKYIKENNIEINRWDKSMCTSPLLYE